MNKNEHERLEALRQYQIMDTGAERSFDDLTYLASEICRTPIALLTLLDGERQWFKSAHGIETRETPREYAFCSQAILEPETLVVSDALVDPRFCGNALVVGEPHIRFYAGSPLVNRDGYALGTLCVIDVKPKDLLPPQLSALEALSRSAIALIEARRIARLLAETTRSLNAEMVLKNRAESHKLLLFKTVRLKTENLEAIDGLLPICAYCKGMQDEDGLWHRLESYIARHSNAQLTHGICPGCSEKELAKVASYSPVQ